MSNTTQNNIAEIDGVCDMLHNISTANNEDSIPTCANCGKEGSDVTNTCNKCKSVKYCNAACKKKHRHKHKKECERRVAELHDEQLFKQPPSDEDCPICFIRLPDLGSGSVYMSCCGKVICRGCIYAVQKRDAASGLCPFCRTPPLDSDAEMIKRYEKRMNLNDYWAIRNIASFYSSGERGLPQNHVKALKLWQQAAKLGHTNAYYNIGMAYVKGNGVIENGKEAIHYLELAAVGGDAVARCFLGVYEEEAGNMDRALKHFRISVAGGVHGSLGKVQELYVAGQATKDDYAKALRSYQAYLDEIRTDQRDEAAATNDEYKYYHSAF